MVDTPTALISKGVGPDGKAYPAPGLQSVGLIGGDAGALGALVGGAELRSLNAVHGGLFQGGMWGYGWPRWGFEGSGPPAPGLLSDARGVLSGRCSGLLGLDVLGP